MRTPSSIVLAWVCFGAAIGCSSDQPSAEQPALESPAVAPVPVPAGPPVGALVVIDEQRGMFKTAHAEAGRIPSKPGSRISIVEVVALAGEFIEVRTIGAGRAGICANSRGVVGPYVLRFFVRPDALQPVLARAKRVEFDDGTSLELAPGLPVLATGERGSVRVGEAVLPVALDDADVGLWFVAPPIERADDLPGVFWDAGDTLYYGQHSFEIDEALFALARERYVIEGGQRLIFVNTCGRFVLRAEAVREQVVLKGPKDAVPALSRNFTVTDTMGCSKRSWEAAAGTELSWLGGGAAGTVVVVAAILPDSATERADRVCFMVSELDVCIETAKLQSRGDPDCKPLDLDLAWDLPERAGRVQLVKAKVGEGLDLDIVRRIVRAHLNEVRSCYDSGLELEPTITGRVEIAFEILATGKVGSSSVRASSLEPADKHVSSCIAKAVKRWTFTKPRDGSSVSVVYPFDLSPMESSSRPPAAEKPR